MTSGRTACTWRTLACTLAFGGSLSAASGAEKPGAANAVGAGLVGSSGKITRFELINPGKEQAAEVPLTFGQVFKPGDLPAGSGLSARTESGEPVPLQADIKATHRDGSVRHAVLTVRAPRLAPGGAARIDLLRADSPAMGGTPIRIENLLATAYDAVVEVKLAEGAYRASAMELLKAAAASNAPKCWLSGPLAGEWTVTAPLRKSDGTAHPHLAARFDVRAYAGLKQVRTDVCIENNWAFEPAPSGFVYDVTITSGGKTAYSQAGLKHTHHARWHRRVWWGEAPGLEIKPDGEYLIATKAIPNYDRSIQLAPSVLEKMPAEYEPMSNGALTSPMPDTGAHTDIGPLPCFAAVYAVTMDPRARANTLANGDCGGSYHIHYRDRQKDRPVSIDDYPYMTIVGDRSRNPKTGKSEAFPKVTNGLQRHIPDDAHQPSIAFLPYLISGDRFYLEELQFWANYNMVRMNNSYRKYEKGVFAWGQVRAIAWNMRTLAQTAYITPDADPMKQYFEGKLSNNIAFFNQQFPADEKCEKTASPLGVLVSGQWSGLDRPWMDDFATWAFGYVVDLGYGEAKPMSLYKCKFVVGRMTLPYNWLNATVPTAKDKDAGHKLFRTFEDYYKANFHDFPTGVRMNGYPDSPYGYGANMQPALAAAVDAGYPGAKEAWALYQTRDPKQNYHAAPTWNIVPRGVEKH